MRHLAVVAAIAGAVAWAQQKPVDIADQAHAPLFQPPPSKDLAGLTDRLAKSLPAEALAKSDVPIRNFVDSQIFGRMIRESVPHAPSPPTTNSSAA